MNKYENKVVLDSCKTETNHTDKKTQIKSEPSRGRRPVSIFFNSSCLLRNKCNCVNNVSSPGAVSDPPRREDLSATLFCKHLELATFHSEPRWRTFLLRRARVETPFLKGGLFYIALLLLFKARRMLAYVSAAGTPTVGHSPVEIREKKKKKRQLSDAVTSNKPQHGRYELCKLYGGFDPFLSFSSC